MKLFLEDLANLRGFLGREIAEDEITEVDEGKVRGVCPPPSAAPEDGGNLSLF